MLSIVLLLSLTANAALLVFVRYLSVSPSFGIANQPIGKLMVATATGPRIWVYGDIDHLGLINFALNTVDVPGMMRWNQIMTEIQCYIRSSEKFLVYGGDEFGWGLKLDSIGWRRKGISEKDWEYSAIRFCERVQQLLREYKYEEWEKEALMKHIGQPYASITLAYEYSGGIIHHRSSFIRAHTCVTNAKPKDGTGDRGKILRAQ